jgi:hypothetical protein
LKRRQKVFQAALCRGRGWIGVELNRVNDEELDFRASSLAADYAEKIADRS